MLLLLLLLLRCAAVGGVDSGTNNAVNDSVIGDSVVVVCEGGVVVFCDGVRDAEFSARGVAAAACEVVVAAAGG